MESIQTCETDRLDLPVRKPKLMFAGAGLAFANIAVATLKTMQNAPANTTFGVVIRWLIAAMYSYATVTIGMLMLEKKRTYLLASRPPVFVTERTWFGKLNKTEKQVLDGAAWVRVAANSTSSEHPDLLCVEVGTHGYITTAVHSRGYSDDADISACKEICTRVAQFLKLEDKGYSYYDHNGVKHTG